MSDQLITTNNELNSGRLMAIISVLLYGGIVFTIIKSLSTCHPAKNNSFTCLSGSTHSMNAISYSYDVCDNYCSYVNFVSGSSICALYIGSFGSNSTAIDEAHSYSIGKYYDLMYTDDNKCYEPTTYLNIPLIVSILCLIVALMCFGQSMYYKKKPRTGIDAFKVNYHTNQCNI